MPPDALAEVRARTEELKGLTESWERAHQLHAIAGKNEEELTRLRRLRELDEREAELNARDRRPSRR